MEPASVSTVTPVFSGAPLNSVVSLLNDAAASAAARRRAAARVVSGDSVAVGDGDAPTTLPAAALTASAGSGDLDARLAALVAGGTLTMPRAGLARGAAAAAGAPPGESVAAATAEGADAPISTHPLLFVHRSDAIRDKPVPRQVTRSGVASMAPHDDEELTPSALRAEALVAAAEARACAALALLAVAEALDAIEDGGAPSTLSPLREARRRAVAVPALLAGRGL